MGDPKTHSLIFVAGCPSGGTSMVAGILHHLGVNMGRFMDRPGSRGYTTFEDCDMERFKDGSGRPSIPAYVDYRLQGPGPYPRGFKHTPLWLDGTDDVPLEVIHVQRPLEDAIKSDALKMAAIAETGRPGYPRTREDFRNRAGTVARAWEAARQVAKAYPCIMALRYYDVLTERALWVTSIAAALGLPTEGEGFQRALAFVDPGKRHV